MSKFSIQAPLRSCSVSKDTVERLERYIFDKAATINQLSLEHIREDYQIESIDSLGTETLRSIHEHGRHQFYNDTKRLMLTYRRYHDKLTVLKIGFGLSKLWSSIELTVDGPDARETAMTILHDVQVLLKEHGNLNFIFHGRYSILPYIAFGISIGVLSVLLDPGISELIRMRDAWIAAGILAVLALFAMTRRVNPYIVFDTPDNEKAQLTYGWVLKALLGVVALAGLTRLLLFWNA
jgi:hypothetical protein